MGMFVVDVESDGPCPGIYSMVCFGAVYVPDQTKTFYGDTSPISDKYIEEALSISGFSRESHEKFDDPFDTMSRFRRWILETNQNGRPVFVSDNPAFDWQWINYYFHYYLRDNPFGFSARRIGDMYAGLRKDIRKASSWKHLRKTNHDHNPVNDALGNAQALIQMWNGKNII